MAASTDKYSTDKFVAASTAGDKPICLLPLKLAEYGDKAGAKEKFYLDDIKETTDKSGKGVFIGLVKVGTFNYLMHNPTRINRVALASTTGDLLILVDGGLNTYGEAEFSKIASETATIDSHEGEEEFLPRLNSAKVFLNIRSSYYAHGNSFIEFRRQGTTTFDRRAISFEPAKKNGYSSEFIYVFHEVGYWDFRGVYVNEEGEHTGSIATKFIFAPLWKAKFNAQYPSYANTSSIIKIYTNTADFETIKDGGRTKFYSDEACTTEAPLGYYIIGDTWYEFKYSVPNDVNAILRSGPVGSWPNDDPGYVPPPGLEQFIEVTMTSFDVEYGNGISYLLAVNSISISITNRNEIAVDTISVFGIKIDGGPAWPSIAMSSINATNLAAGGVFTDVSTPEQINNYVHEGAGTITCTIGVRHKGIYKEIKNYIIGQLTDR